MLEQQAIARTVHGIVPTFAQVLKDARYAKCLYSNREHGTKYDYGYPEAFVSTLGAKGKLPDATPWNPKRVLVATPVIETGTYFPSIGNHNGDTHCTSLEIIAWEDAGHFLVIGSGPSGIESRWLCFVPIDQRFEVAA